MQAPQEPRTLSIGKVFILCLICCVLGYTAARTGSGPAASPKSPITPTATAPAPPGVVPDESKPEAVPTTWTVARVLEPNLIELQGGVTVALLGVEVPEEPHYAQISLAFLRGAVEGRKVKLEFEPENDLGTGSPLAYVYLEDGTLVNAELLKNGYLAASTGEYRLYTQFSRYEEQAKHAKLGVWSTEEPTSDITEVVTAPETQEYTSSSDKPIAPSVPTPNVDPYPLSTPTSSETYTTSSPSVEAPSYSVPPGESYKPPVAENGSYYGQISERTGRPKTVHVNGYYRRDGTYVRGHYRSSPRR